MTRLVVFGMGVALLAGALGLGLSAWNRRDIQSLTVAVVALEARLAVLPDDVLLAVHENRRQNRKSMLAVRRECQALCGLCRACVPAPHALP